MDGQGAVIPAEARGGHVPPLQMHPEHCRAIMLHDEQYAVKNLLSCEESVFTTAQLTEDPSNPKHTDTPDHGMSAGFYLNKNHQERDNVEECTAATGPTLHHTLCWMA